MDKYVLMLKATVNGKDDVDVLPIYEDDLKHIDCYTSYNGDFGSCYDAKGLFNSFSDEVKIKINNLFDMKKGFTFFIRKKCDNIRLGRTNLDVLHAKDSDIVHCNDTEFKNNLASMCLSGKEGDERKIAKEFFSKFFKIIDLNKSKYGEFCDYVDNNANENERRVNKIANSADLLEELSGYINTYGDQRKVLCLLKDYKMKIDDLKHTHTWLTSRENIRKRQKKYKRSYSLVCNRMASIIEGERNYFKENYNIEFQDKKDVIPPKVYKYMENSDKRELNKALEDLEDYESLSPFDKYMLQEGVPYNDNGDPLYDQFDDYNDGKRKM